MPDSANIPLMIVLILFSLAEDEGVFSLDPAFEDPMRST
jgi:hypothetical protein